MALYASIEIETLHSSSCGLGLEYLNSGSFILFTPGITVVELDTLSLGNMMSGNIEAITGSYFVFSTSSIDNHVELDIADASTIYAPVEQFQVLNLVYYYKRGRNPTNNQFEYWVTQDYNGAPPSGNSLVEITVLQQFTN